MADLDDDGASDNYNDDKEDNYEDEDVFSFTDKSSALSVDHDEPKRAAGIESKPIAEIKVGGKVEIKLEGEVQDEVEDGIEDEDADNEDTLMSIGSFTSSRSGRIDQNRNRDRVEKESMGVTALFAGTEDQQPTKIVPAKEKKRDAVLSPWAARGARSQG